MASIGSFPFVIETKTESLVLLHGKSQNRRRIRCRAKKFENLSVLSKGVSVRLMAVRATSKDGGESSDDALQATIEKSKKVLAMQRDLLQQISERKKLVSSIKSSIINPEEEGTLKETKSSIISPEEEGTSKETKSSTINPEEEKGASNNQRDIKTSSNSSDDSGASYEQIKKSPTHSGRAPSSPKKTLEQQSKMKISSYLRDEELETVSSDVGKSYEVENDLDQNKPLKLGSFSKNSTNDLKETTAENVWSEELPSFLSNTSKTSTINDVKYEDSTESALPDINNVENDKETEEAPPPLAGVNVMNVILVAAECAPFVKTGGLGDVAGSLPKALARRGHRVMVVVPRYSDYKEAQETGIRRRYKVDGQDMEINYFQAYIDGVDFVFIDSPIFRHLDGNVYGGNRMDILKRMILFCKAAIEVPWYVPCGGVCYGDGNLVFIANDWHTALLPVYLKACYRDNGLMKYTRSVLVIHNIAHQGRGPVDDFSYVDLPEHYIDLFKLYDPVGGDHFNIFAAGLKTADRVVTVSHGYAWEVKTSEGGWGLHNIINENDWKLRGIVNGIDTKEWNPKYDVYLQTDGYTNYSLETLNSGKAQCKAALQRELGLPIRPDVPLIGFIGRLDPQKGVDLIAEAIPWMMGQDVQLVMLGTGRPDLEQMLRQIESQHHEKIRGWVGFSVKTSHRITAGADILLMPSRFEPCGLNQLYAMMYGTVPVVHAVGGLRDTVQPFDPFNETGLGWTFDRAEANKLIDALGNCLLTYRQYKESWEGLQRRGMSQDLSWDNAAEKYEEVLIAAKYQW